MSEDQKTPMTNHSYDGIEEFDNPLPNWWLISFMGTIIFGFIYFIHYSFGGGETQSQELARQLKELPQTLEKTWNETDLQAKMDGEGPALQGKAVFAGKCASCHGPNGQGLIGPNLTDHFWIHGKGTRADIMKVISDGVLEKGMPSWTGLITDDEMIQVAAFIRSLKDTHPQNPKAPQGEEVKD